MGVSVSDKNIWHADLRVSQEIKTLIEEQTNEKPKRVTEESMIREAIETLVRGQSLSVEQAKESMNEIMEGEATIRLHSA